jgi:hypothetical protein
MVQALSAWIRGDVAHSADRLAHGGDGDSRLMDPAGMIP